MATQTLSWLPSIPYPPEQHGRWSPVTSTIDWCEENYYATVYSAEIVNTLTNLLFAYLAAKGIHNTLTQGHDRVFLVGFIGYLLVGTGSFLFHSTLKYPLQLVDELSMIYTTCLMCYATFSYAKSRRYRIGLAVSLTSLASFITLYYHYLEDPTFHEIAYALLTVIVLLRSVYVMETSLRPRFRSKEDAPAIVRHQNGEEKLLKTKEHDRDEEILRRMWSMIRWGASLFLGGFFIWSLDNAYCSTLRRWRHRVGLPWGIILEGHGWWHCMTGIGSYYYLVWNIWLRQCLNDKQDDYDLIWPRFHSMPTVVRYRSRQGNGQASSYENGSAAVKED